MCQPSASMTIVQLVRLRNGNTVGAGAMARAGVRGKVMLHGSPPRLRQSVSCSFNRYTWLGLRLGLGLGLGLGSALRLGLGLG